MAENMTTSIFLIGNELHFASPVFWPPKSENIARIKRAKGRRNMLRG